MEAVVSVLISSTAAFSLDWSQIDLLLSTEFCWMIHVKKIPSWFLDMKYEPCSHNV